MLFGSDLSGLGVDGVYVLLGFADGERVKVLFPTLY